MTIHNSDSGGMTAHAIDGAMHTGALTHAATSGKTATDHHSNANDPTAGEKTHLTAITAEAVAIPAPAVIHRAECLWKANSLDAQADTQTTTGGGGASITAVIKDGRWCWCIDTGGGFNDYAQLFLGSNVASPNHGGIFDPALSPTLIFGMNVAEVSDDQNVYYAGISSDAGAANSVQIAFEKSGAHASNYWQLELEKAGAAVYTPTSLLAATGWLWWKIVYSAAQVVVSTSPDLATWTTRLTYATAANIPVVTGCPRFLCFNNGGWANSKLWIDQVYARQSFA